MIRDQPQPVDLTVVIVSFNDKQWLEPCLLSLYQRAGGLNLDVVVVDNGSDGAHEVIRTQFPEVRVVRSENRGFAHANNLAVMSGTGRYVLFLNPDTEMVDGSLRDLLDVLEARPEVGLVGVRQVTADGTLWPTIRYFPCFTRALGDAVGAERWPGRPPWAGEREVDLSVYEHETDCDWTSGSFMLVRRQALLSAGLFDERFFLYSEEPDLCLRIKRAGWSVRHLPHMTILHHAGKGGKRPRMAAQDVFTRRQYARKHFSTPHRCAYLAAIASGYVVRAALQGRDEKSQARGAARIALATLSGRAGPPFVPPPRTALPECGPPA